MNVRKGIRKNNRTYIIEIRPYVGSDERVEIVQDDSSIISITLYPHENSKGTTEICINRLNHNFIRILRNVNAPHPWNFLQGLIRIGYISSRRIMNHDEEVRIIA